MASAFEGWNQGIGDDDEDDEIREESYNTRESILFLLEATPSMLSPTLAAEGSKQDGAVPATQDKSIPKGGWKEHPKSKMEVALRCAFAVMKRKVLSAPKDSTGILVFNTTARPRDKSDNLNQFCSVLLELKQPDAINIRKMKEFLTKVQDDPTLLARTYKPNTGTNIIADAFGCCSTIFRTRAPYKGSKRIFLVTDNDNPVGDNEQLHIAAMNKRKDLLDMNYEIEPFFIPPSDNLDFDLLKFYGEIITAGGEDEGRDWPVVFPDLAFTLSEMFESMRTKEAVKRKMFSVPFILGEDFVIGVDGYNLVGEEKRRTPVKVDLNTAEAQEVVSRTVYTDAETGESLDPKREIKKYFQVGKADFDHEIQASKVFFSEADIRKVKSLGRSPHLRLLGFKPRQNFLKIQESVKHSYFIYPTEEVFGGSTRTFAALLRTMIRKDKIGFGSFIARSVSRPQIVLLIPQSESLTESGIQTAPPGIHVCQLPFADDLRELGDINSVSVVKAVSGQSSAEPNDSPAVEAAKDIVRFLSKTYNPALYPNPALNFFYDTLAALALEEDELPEPVDKTIPLYHIIDKRVGKHIHLLRELIQEDAVDNAKVATSKRRRLSIDNTEAPEEDLQGFARALKKQGDAMKNEDIKFGLKMLKEKTVGNKAALFERARAALEARNIWQNVKVEDSGDGEEHTQKKSSRKKRYAVESDTDDDVKT